MAPARRGLRLGGYGVSVIDMAAPRPVAVTVSVSTPASLTDRPPKRRCRRGRSQSRITFVTGTVLLEL